jgi:hypothetical protein
MNSDNKKEKPISKIVEEFLIDGRSVDLDFLSDKGHDVRNLSIIISRLKIKYPYIETSSKVSRAGKSISVYSMPM